MFTKKVSCRIAHPSEVREATPESSRSDSKGWIESDVAQRPASLLLAFNAFENLLCSAGIAITASATARASIGAAPAAVVQKTAARPSWPARDHEKHIQDEEPDGDVVEQRCLGKVCPKLVRRPEKKGRRQQNGLEQFRRGARTTRSHQLKNQIGARDHRQAKRR